MIEPNDTTQVGHICEAIKNYLDRLPDDQWKQHHYVTAHKIGYERKQDDTISKQKV